MSKQTVVAMVVIEIDLPTRITLDDPRETDITADIRTAVLTVLPRTDRLVAVLAEGEARMMLAAHVIAMEATRELVVVDAASARGRRLH